MKTLKNLVMATLMSGAMAVSNPTHSQHSETQKQETSKEQKLFPNLNFYFETGESLKYENLPEFKKYILAWLCNCPKENNTGNIFFNYGDTDGDGFYDHIVIEKSDEPIRTQEKFYFNINTKKIDYVLDIYEFCPKIITDCDKIISKSYNEIDQKESYQIGEDFNEIIKKFISVQKEFNRFNPEQLEKIVREEYEHRLKLVDGKLIGNSRTPLEKFLSEEEIKKVENYIKGKPERERIKREQEERAKVFRIEQEKIAKAEYEKGEKIRREQEEAKKITAILGLSGGIENNIQGKHTGLFFGITPQLTNKKGKGFVAGLDLFMMDSKMEFELDGGSEDKKTYLGSYNYISKYLFSHTSYTHSVLAKTTSSLGLNMGYISPALKIFAQAGFLGRRTQVTTTALTEEYIEEGGIKQGVSSFKTEKNYWEVRGFVDFEDPPYFGLGMEIFPFLKENGQEKNISLSLDWLISKRGGEFVADVYTPKSVYYPSQSIIKTGLKYTFRKK